MKNYKKIVPFVLVLLMAVSCYKLIADAKTLENEYLGYIEEARQKKEKGIYMEAVKLYKKALDMNETIEICSEIGDVILAEGNKRDEVAWGEYMMEKFPTEAEGYEYLINLYVQEGNYKSCFFTYELAKKRQAISKTMQDIRKTIEYEYELGYDAYSDVTVFGGGYCAVTSEDAWGYVDEAGEIAIKPKYKKAGVFGSEAAPITDKEGKVYFIDKEGNKVLVIPQGVKGEELGFFENNIYALSDGIKYRYYNRDGLVVLESYDIAATFNYDRAAVNQSGAWYFIKSDGSKLNDSMYETIALDGKGISFRNERAFGKTGKGYVMIDLDGKQVGTQVYQEAKPFLEDTLAAVKVGEKWGFIDKFGKMVIDAKFEEADSFTNGFAPVRVGSLWGYCNTEGTVVIAPAFEGAKSLSVNECGFVKKNGEWVYLKLLRSNY